MKSLSQETIERFEREGIHTVRLKLDNGGYPGMLKQFAAQWLGQKLAKAEAEAQEIAAIHMTIAKASMEAAQISAEAAKKSNYFAFGASIVSVISAIIAVVAIYAQLAQ